jgi:hypothetical protein
MLVLRDPVKLPKGTKIVAEPPVGLELLLGSPDDASPKRK